MNQYGVKCERLLHLRAKAPFTELIPILYPIDAKLAHNWLASYKGKGEALTSELAAYLQSEIPSLYEKVMETCGPLPWIIRSSGDEDQLEFTNAGAYLSLTCHAEDQFYDRLAQVMRGGQTERARNQGTLFKKKPEVAPLSIPVFIQPLIQSERNGEEPVYDTVPYIHETELKKIVNLLEHIHLDMAAIPLDCEWVADTEHGIVSMTSLTECNQQEIVGQIAFGFQLFSTQHVQAGNSVRYIFPGRDLNLWYGRTFQEVVIHKLYLVQVRPAAHYRLLQNVYALMDGSRQQLDSKMGVCLTASEVIIHGKQPFIGKFMKTATLNEAWNTYLSDAIADHKNEIAAVFVEVGSRTEHAGIMFSQIGIPVFRLAITAIPETLHYVVVDPFTMQCRFYNHNELDKPEYTIRELLSLPDSCMIVHTQERSISCKMLDEEVVDKYFAQLLDYPYISEQLKRKWVWNSKYPAHQFVLYGTDSQYSPTYYGRAVSGIRHVEDEILEDLTRLASKWPEAARDYLNAFLYVKGWNKDGCLADVQFDFGSGHKLRTEVLVYWKMMRVKHLLASPSNKTLPQLLHRLQADFSEGRLDEGMHRLDILHDFNAYIYSLPLYTEAEQRQRSDEFYRILARTESADLPILHQLCKDVYLNAGQLCRFMNAAFSNRRLLELYNQYSSLNSELSLSPYNMGILHHFLDFNAVIQQLFQEIGPYKELADMNSSLFHIAVERYDHAAKEILLYLSQYGDSFYYEGYLKLLHIWLEFIENHAEPSKALQTFADWLNAQWGRQQEVKNYFLEEVHWKAIVQKAQDGGYLSLSELSIQNPHQLHNVLHQWSLSLAPVSGSELMPTFLQEMIVFANTFSEKENRLLRSQNDFFEIELSMCTHKAGFTFYSNIVFVEFSEPPSVEDDEIARLMAFTICIEKFNRWFDDYRFVARFEKVVGTWTSYISITALDQGALSQKDYRRIFEIMRFMLDSSYDFSHTPNEVVNELDAAFHEPEWKFIFKKLLAYRVQYDDSQQFVNVHLFAISSFMTNICISPTLREQMLGLYRGGFDVMLGEFSRSDLWISNTERYSEWSELYKKATLIALFLSSIWPDETVSNLHLLKDKPAVLDLLCKNLFRRKDISVRVYDLHVTLDDTSRERFIEKMLHYCPHVYMDKVMSIDGLAERLACSGKKYKRAKQYMLHAYAHVIQSERVTIFIEDLQYIPYGKGEEQEQVLRKNMLAHKHRYDITKEVLYI